MDTDEYTSGELFSEEWLLSRRIAHKGYPPSEAKFNSVSEYIQYLENENSDLREYKYMYEDLNK